MPRYTKQRDDFRCGPVSILNALKWAGVDISHAASIAYLSELCDCTESLGTAHKDFDRAIRKAGKGILRVRLVRHPSLGEIEEHLREGGALVLNYRWRREKKGTAARHFSLLTDISPSGRSFYIANGRHDRKALQRMNRERFKKWELRFQRTDPNYKAWFLTRAGE